MCCRMQAPQTMAHMELRGDQKHRAVRAGITSPFASVDSASGMLFCAWSPFSSSLRWCTRLACAYCVKIYKRAHTWVNACEGMCTNVHLGRGHHGPALLQFLSLFEFLSESSDPRAHLRSNRWTVRRVLLLRSLSHRSHDESLSLQTPALYESVCPFPHAWPADDG